MADIFNSVKNLRPRKNAFNLSHGNTLTTDMGLLVPVFVRNCVPNSDFRVNTHGLGRMAALISPVMDNIDLYLHFWKVPYRIMDKHFPEFISGDIDEDYNPPYFTMKGINDALVTKCQITLQGNEKLLPFACPGSLLDHLGYNALKGTTNASLISTRHLEIREIQAYAFLLMYAYHVENIRTELDSCVETLTGVSTLYGLLEILTQNDLEGNQSDLVAAFLVGLAALPGNPFEGDLESQDRYSDPKWWKFSMFRHAWKRDYFTSAFPWVQKGDPVTIPISGTSAPVTIPAQDFTLNAPPHTGSTYYGVGVTLKENVFGANEIAPFTTGPLLEGHNNTELRVDNTEDASLVSALWGKNSELEGTADLTEATSITINELRILNALQVYKERALRYGGRYKEYLKGFFNQTSLDARLDYPEWLGGGKLLFNVSDIAQTSETDTTPQGHLAGKGTAFGTGFAGFKHTHIYEESVIIGVMYVAPKPAYCQGLDRFKTKLNDRFDYFNASFEHVGEQEVKKYELYNMAQDSRGDEIFGYQVRYAEYRSWPSEVHGELKETLSYWKLTRIFSGIPSLNANFVYMQPDQLMRIFATPDPGHLIIDLWFDVKALQPMSKYGTPMLMA